MAIFLQNSGMSWAKADPRLKNSKGINMLHRTLSTIIHLCLTLFVTTLPLFMVRAESRRASEFDTSTFAIKAAVRQVTRQEQTMSRAKPLLVSSNVARISVVTLDTRDTESCHVISQILQSLKPIYEDGHHTTLCNKRSLSTPIARILIAQNSSAEELVNHVDLSSLSEKERDLAFIANGTFKQTGFMGLIWSASSNQKLPNAAQVHEGASFRLTWHKNSSILTSQESSIFVSTFFWDYGLAEFETLPSLSDLIATTALNPIIESYYHKLESQEQSSFETPILDKAKFAIVTDNLFLGENSSIINLAERNKSQTKTSLFIRKHRPDPWSLESSIAIGVEFQFKFHGH